MECEGGSATVGGVECEVGTVERFRDTVTYSASMVTRYNYLYTVHLVIGNVRSTLLPVE